jgi:hypothetical protein
MNTYGKQRFRLEDNPRIYISLVFVVAWAVGLLYGIFLIAGVLFQPNPLQLFTVPPLGDVAQSVVGLNFFLNDSWRFPLFAIPRAGFPEGTSAIFTDSIPILALAIKLANKVSLNLQGDSILWYVPILWSLNCLAMVVVFRSLDLRKISSMVVAIILVMSSPIILERSTHIALQSHYLFLFSFSLFIYIAKDISASHVSRGKKRCFYQILLTCLAAWIHFYLFVILFFLTMATFILLTRKRIISIQTYVIYCLIFFIICASLLYISGYFIRDGIALSITATYQGGFNSNSANLATFITGSTGWTLGELLNLTRNVTGGQYEGYSYLGWPLIIALLASLLTDRASWRAFLSRNPELLAVTLVLFVYSLSMVVHFSDIELVDYSIVKPYVRIFTAPMTSPGRFVWPFSYLVGIVAIALLLKRIENSPNSLYRIVFLVFIGTISFFESDALVSAYRKPYLNLATASELSAHETKINEQLTSIISESTSIVFFPSMPCSRRNLSWPRMFRIHLIASEKNIPINENYNARVVKDCDQEKELLLSREEKDPHQLIIVRDSEFLPLISVPNYYAYVHEYPDLLDSYRITENTEGTISEFGRAHWKERGLTEGRVIPRFPIRLLQIEEYYSDLQNFSQQPLCIDFYDLYFCK